MVNLAFTGDLDRHQREARVHWGGGLCVIRQPRKKTALRQVSDDISNHLTEAGDAGIHLVSWGVDEAANVMRVDVLLADQAAQDWFDRRYAGVVSLSGRLQPVG